jgi:paraquat-inducible protein B
VDRKKSRPALVGAFVLAVVALVVGALVLWGSGRVFQRRYRYLCNFEGSVNGLRAGSLVKFHGVPVGSVQEVWIEASRQGADPRAKVAVAITIDSGVIRGPEGSIEPSPEVVRRMIMRGLRAQLQLESVVTNLLYVSLEIIPSAPAVAITTSADGVLEIPTRPSRAETLINAIYALGEKASAIDLVRLSESLERTTEAIGNLAGEPEIRHALDEVTRGAASIRRLAGAIQQEVTPLGRTIRGTARTATAGVGSLDAVLTDLHATLTPGAPLVVDLARTLNELRRAARSINSLAEMVERNPSAFLVGKPKEP